MPGARHATPRGVTQEEVRALLSVPDRDTPVGLRDIALLTALATQGWRVSEALGLTVEDLDEEAGHKVATICGKGGKVVRVTLSAPTWTAITIWTTVAGISTGAIFVAVTKGGDIIPGKAISHQSAWKRIRHLARKAGITQALHPHLFRHGAVTAPLAACGFEPVRKPSVLTNPPAGCPKRRSLASWQTGAHAPSGGRLRPPGRTRARWRTPM